MIEAKKSKQELVNPGKVLKKQATLWKYATDTSQAQNTRTDNFQKTSFPRVFALSLQTCVSSLWLKIPSFHSVPVKRLVVFLRILRGTRTLAFIQTTLFISCCRDVRRVWENEIRSKWPMLPLTKWTGWFIFSSKTDRLLIFYTHTQIQVTIWSI